MRERRYRVLSWIAIAMAVVTVGWMVAEYLDVAGQYPGRIAYREGNRAFLDGRYEEALEKYRDALALDERNVYAAEGVARSLQRLQRHDAALVAFDAALAIEPEFAAGIANRGILLDTMGRHEDALKAYRSALVLDPDLSDGMHWIDRLLYNVQVRPPTVEDRMRYLEEQLALPEHRRVLVRPLEDLLQRPYER
jgi:tetratricopeptide (TPR) repeat protein